MSYNTFKLHAPAKINLFLHITGRRDDGYHLLQSVMVFVDVGDELEFSPHDTLFIDVDGPFAGDMPPPHENLIYKAAQLLAQEYKTTMRGAIRLTKRLPVASGIAGGSSDTAAALRATEMGCDALLKATQVDGVYDSDPLKNKDAQRFETLSYLDVLSKDLKVMDASAISLARENKIPILVFSIHKHGAFRDVLCGRGRYTKITD